MGVRRMKLRLALSKAQRAYDDAIWPGNVLGILQGDLREGAIVSADTVNGLSARLADSLRKLNATIGTSYSEAILVAQRNYDHCPEEE